MVDICGEYTARAPPGKYLFRELDKHKNARQEFLKYYGENNTQAQRDLIRHIANKRL